MSKRRAHWCWLEVTLDLRIWVACCRCGWRGEERGAAGWATRDAHSHAPARKAA